MQKQKLSETMDVELAETEGFVLKGIDKNIWLNALQQSSLNRFEEEKIKKTAQLMCLKYKTTAALHHDFTTKVHEKLPRNSFEKRIKLMTYVLAMNYLRLKERDNLIKAYNAARENMFSK